MKPWQRIFVKAAGFGAGVTIAILCAVITVIYYNSMPHAQKQWNRAAINASFRELSLTPGEAVAMHFAYSLENTTDLDYKFPVDISSNIFIASPKENQLYQANNSPDPYLTKIDIDRPVFIPAKQKVIVTINLTYNYNDEFPKADNGNMDKLPAYAKHRLERINGFELFDSDNRYQIIMPKGNDNWNNSD